MRTFDFNYSLSHQHDLAKCNGELELAKLRIKLFCMDQIIISPVSKLRIKIKQKKVKLEIASGVN